MARVLFAAALVGLAGCAGGTRSFLREDVDFGHIRRCAVIPFQNLTSDSFADERIQSIFVIEVLHRKSIELVEPEEAASAARELRLAPGALPTPEQVVSLGKALSVEGIFMGTVEEYGQNSSSRSQNAEVTATFSLAETETGATIWRSQVHAAGSTFWKKLFGGEPTTAYAVSRKAVREALESLF